MIAITDLVKRFGQNEIIRGISLVVPVGEVAVIIGPSGGGKSTFLRCINGLESFQSGRVQVSDLVLTPETNPKSDARLLRSVRTLVGMVFQQFNLFPISPCSRTFARRPSACWGSRGGEAEHRAVTLLDRVGLAAARMPIPATSRAAKCSA